MFRPRWADPREAESVRSVRIVRAGLVVGWFLIAALVVAGFAAFSAQDTATAPSQTVASADVGDLGRITGAVAGLSFAATTPTVSATTTSLDLDPSASSIGADAVAATTTTVVDDRRNGVYVRSAYLSEPEVRALVAEFFQPEDVNKAVRVAFCESSFNPAAVNPATGASGLFQHLPEHWAERSESAGWTGSSIFEPRANVAVAAWLLYEFPGGWTHWDCNP